MSKIAKQPTDSDVVASISPQATRLIFLIYCTICFFELQKALTFSTKAIVTLALKKVIDTFSMLRTLFAFPWEKVGTLEERSFVNIISDN